MILLMGIAGSGKGTQGKMLADQYAFHLLSMGDILRMYITGKQRERMLKGGLIGDDEIIKIVDRVLQSIPDDEEVLLDGFPRTVRQAEWLLEQVEVEKRFQLKTAFNLVASREAVKKRLLGRARIDDIEESIEKRFDEYQRLTEPLLKWLSEHGIDVVNIDAERSVESINADLVNYLKQS